MSKHHPLPDADTRDIAAHRFDQNLVITAGAGTGKTSLLVERTVNLVLTGTASIDELVIMTFTKKAAAELRERIAEAFIEIIEATDPRGAVEPDKDHESARCLRWLRDQDIDPAELHQRAETALHQLDGASVGTIHGFASEILRRHPVEAKLPPEFTPDEGEERALLFERVWPDFLARELGPRGEAGDLWRTTLEQFRVERIGELAKTLINSPHVLDHLLHHEYTDRVPDNESRTVIQKLRGRLEGHLAKLAQGKDPHSQAVLQIEMLGYLLEGNIPGIQDAMDRTNRERVAAGQSELKDTFWKHGYKRPKSPEDAITDLNLAATLLKPCKRVSRRNLVPLMQVLRRFAFEFNTQASRAGMPAMDDLLIRTRNLLRDHESVRRREAARAGRLLLDEFQDTDPLQYEIAFLLTAEDPGGPVTDPHALRPRAGRLFIVGDPKQSIYRFRGADIVAYERAVQHIKSHDGGVHVLSTNFRSLPGIVDPINDLFRSHMKADEAGAEVDYQPILAHRSADGTPNVEVISVPAQTEAKVGVRRDAEAAIVADRVLEELKHTAQKDIAILFRSMTRAPIYTRSLRERGIHFIVEGGKSFAERPEVVESLGLLRALANPADPVATLAALRGVFGGVTDPELAAFAAAGGMFSWNRPRMDQEFSEHAAILHAFTRLRKLDQETRSFPTDRRIHAALLESDFGLLQASFFEGAQRIANVRKLAERAAAVARNRRLGLDATMQAVSDDLQGDSREWESPLADEEVDAVRILTVHKAKGLEFKVVILADLPGWGGGGNRNPNTLTLCPDGDRTYVGVRTEYKDNYALAVSKIDETDHESAEMKRILYVALTRAENRLIVVNNDPKNRSSWIKPMVASWEYAYRKGPDPNQEIHGGAILDRAPAVPKSVDPEPKPEPEGIDQAITAFADARNTWGTFTKVRSRTPSSDQRAKRADRNPDDESPATLPPGLAAQVGTVLHESLESWDFTDPDALRHRAAIAARTVAESPWTAEQVAAGAGPILERFLGSDLPGYLRKVDVLAREAPILFRDADGITVHGYADLVYEKDGQVHVADYKSEDPKGDPVRHAEPFRAQLQDYAFAVQRAWNLDHEPVREVMFLPTGDIVPFADTGEPAPPGDEPPPHSDHDDPGSLEPGDQLPLF